MSKVEIPGVGKGLIEIRYHGIWRDPRRWPLRLRPLRRKTYNRTYLHLRLYLINGEWANVFFRRDRVGVLEIRGGPFPSESYARLRPIRILLAPVPSASYLPVALLLTSSYLVRGFPFLFFPAPVVAEPLCSPAFALFAKSAGLTSSRPLRNMQQPLTRRTVRR